jgi:hypothetical protein
MGLENMWINLPTWYGPRKVVAATGKKQTALTKLSPKPKAKTK